MRIHTQCMNDICSGNGLEVTGKQKKAQKYNDNNSKGRDEHECDCAVKYSNSHDGQRHLKEKHHKLNVCWLGVYYVCSLADLRVIH